MYKHISREERKLIEILVQAGNSNKSIAEAIGRSASTILLEIRRNYPNGIYRASVAQRKAEARRGCSKKLIISEKIWAKVFERFNESWSPEQIAGPLQTYERKLFIKSFLSNSFSKIFNINGQNSYNALRYSHFGH